MQASHVPEDGITEGPRASIRRTQTPTAKFSQVPVQNPGSREAFASCRLLLLQPEMSTGTRGTTQSWLCTRSRPRQVVCCSSALHQQTVPRARLTVLHCCPQQQCPRCPGQANTPRHPITPAPTHSVQETKKNRTLLLCVKFRTSAQQREQA